MSRVLKTGANQITQDYAHHTGWSKGVDVVKAPTSLDYIVAHSDGVVIKTMVGQVNGKLDGEGFGYGNYVMIAHKDNYVTLYAHLDKVNVVMGQTVKRGMTIGYMGNTGNSFGAHLHFEVRRYAVNPAQVVNVHDTNFYKWLDPTPYLDADLPLIINTVWRVQTGAYKFKIFAKNMLNKLKKDGYTPIAKKYKDGLIHTQAGAFSNKEYAIKLERELQAKGYDTILTTEDGEDIIL